MPKNKLNYITLTSNIRNAHKSVFPHNKPSINWPCPKLPRVTSIFWLCNFIPLKFLTYVFCVIVLRNLESSNYNNTLLYIIRYWNLNTRQCKIKIFINPKGITTKNYSIKSKYYNHITITCSCKRLIPWNYLTLHSCEQKE